MTKYILNSGNAKYDSQKHKAFIGEALVGLKGNVKVLYCLFAQPREKWEAKFEEYKKSFAALADENVELNFELAFPDKFKEQCSQSDVIMIQGGDDYLLQFWFKQFDLESFFQDKIIATSSAGSDALVSSFWTCDWRKSMKGLNLLPIKFIPHYKSNYGADDSRGKIDWEEAYKELELYEDCKLSIHALKEGEFIVIEK